MSGSKITTSRGKLKVPNDPIIPFIEGDGIGQDIWKASVRVFDAAVAKAFGGKRKIEWREVLAGEKAFNKTGSWLPEATLADCTKRISCIDKRTINYSSRWRYPFAERCPTPRVRPLRLCSSCTLFQGSAFSA